MIINVYLPYQCPANEDNYIEKLGYIHAVIDELNTSYYVVFGDWNANSRDPVNSLFARHMIDLCHYNNSNISTSLMLPDDSYTHVSEDWGLFLCWVTLFPAPIFMTTLLVLTLTIML